jgi:hypothetical protein
VVVVVAAAPPRSQRSRSRLAAGSSEYFGDPSSERRWTMRVQQCVAWCDAAAGAQLQPDKKAFIAPADLANDPNVQALCALCPD